MLRTLAKAAAAAASRAARPVARRMATEAGEAHVATPSAEELKRVMEFGKFVDNRLADSLREIIFRLTQMDAKIVTMEAKMVTKEAMTAAMTAVEAKMATVEAKMKTALSQNTLAILGTLGTVAAGGVTLAYRGGFFDKDRSKGSHEYEEPRLFISLLMELARQIPPISKEEAKEPPVSHTPKSH